MRATIISCCAAALLFAVGCTPAPKSGYGFTLPDGNAAHGRELYVSFQCNACHKAEGIEQSAPEGQEPEMTVKLGGEVSRIKTYGELVTSIINPSHRLAKGYPADAIADEGESKMRSYNDVMTVTELADLVAFLQSKYSIREFEATDYPMYGP